MHSLVFWEVFSFTIAFAGSIAIDESSLLWYSSLDRSASTPSDAFFSIIWFFLYALMGYSAFSVSGKAGFRNLIPFLIQALFNLAWCWVFFYFRKPSCALIVIFLLLCSLLWTVLEFRRYDRLAAGLLIPYVLWVGFAFWLNFYIVINN
ncbi:MAG: tryptophan-rich sensory protein [Synergistaceae bacterium]|nr:tryptophan-rich sensory protein [Synergistaceae bacterium]